MRKYALRLVLLGMGLFIINNSLIPESIRGKSYLDNVREDPPFLQADAGWVDSLMSQMSLEDKIAQMIMVPAYSNRNDDHVQDVEKIIRKHHVGGVIFFQGGPVRQAHMTNRFREASEIPLLVAMDGEWGPGMRLDSVISYPRQMMLGAIRDDSLVFQMGQHIARQMKTLGVQMNFAPVADINNNPQNPVINTRSFGELRDEVSRKVNAYFLGMQQEQLLVTAKHFPGHGDTDSDSHKTLPEINFRRDRLDSLELYPFREAINKGLTGIMVAHLHVPSLDDRENRPTTLSENTITGLLKEELGFKGLIVTDALNMKGVSDHFKPGDLEVEAVLAGNDILLMPDDPGKAINHIKRAVRRGIITEERIDESCRKILLAKAWSGLREKKTVDTKHLAERLNNPHYLPLQHHLVRESLTLVKNNDDLLPLRNLAGLKIVTYTIGAKGPAPFTETTDLYLGGTHHYQESLTHFPAQEKMDELLKDADLLMVNLHGTKSRGAGFGITQETKQFISNLSFAGKIILNVAGYPYALGALDSLDKFDAVIVSYREDDLNQQYAAQAIFGAIPFRGVLPVSAGTHYPAGHGLETAGDLRLKYSVPEMAGMNRDTLAMIDGLIKKAIKEKAMPGCQLLVARRGEVIINRSYGYHTYRNRVPVKNTDIYDLASITKISATIPALMQLQERGLFNTDSTLEAYLPGLKETDKGPLLISDVLTHQAGLVAWIPFYQRTIEPLDTSQSLISNNFSYTYPLKIGNGSYANRNIVYKDSIYQSDYSEAYPLQVAENLFLRADYRDTIFHLIQESPLGSKEYKYSDLGYYMLQRVIEEMTDTLLYPYSWMHFYGPMGAETLGFLPLKRFSKERIVPTENDMVFRKQLIHGHVHDPGAAMLGGICGHAGLFSSANDLAKMMQMYLNYGEYGGIRLLDSTTIAHYTSCQNLEEENRRGLGFDRPITDEEDAGPACDSASATSFGHTGFTGTIAWMDPEYELLYIFLSNRIHPDQSNLKLIQMNVRTDVQEVLYRAMEVK